MARISKVHEIEKERGKPIVDILQEELEKTQNITKVAKNLGVAQSTVSDWIVRHGLELRIVLVPVD